MFGRPTEIPNPAQALPGREVKGLRLARTIARWPFDLTRVPLLRGVLLRLSAEEHFFQFTIHHIVADGWSSGVLVGELMTLYEAFIEHRPSPLAELTIHYGGRTLVLSGEQMPASTGVAAVLR